ncbi:MAG: LbtU family siderophore porin [Desulfobacteraceae bacterium]|nr:MAG: LbtU family siderophore porin [Desulfobacteraceae bacterium]
MKKMVSLMMVSILVNAAAASPLLAQEVISDPKATDSQPGGVKSLEDRGGVLEEALGRQIEGSKWFERIKIGGLIEVEAGYNRIDFDDRTIDDERGSDVDLATVELAVDANIAKYIDGHVLFKYEEDELFVDEGFITLTGTDNFPAYLIAGRQYIPFGNFESHFITDPTTLELGETNEGAVVVGYGLGGELVDICVGVFNGKTKEADANDHIDNLAGRMVVTPVEGITFGASFTSNLAAADSFADQVQRDLNDTVAGWSAFLTLTLSERLTFFGEYVAALEDFEAGELYDGADTRKCRPAAWNLELGYAFTDRWQAALRYGGSTDGDAGSGEFLPTAQYGAIINWTLFENTKLGLEYLRSEFENDYQTSDAFAAQLAIQF